MSIASKASPAPLHDRPAVFVSWITHHGRSEDLARALGTDCVFIAVGSLTRRRTAPLRHAVQTVMTMWELGRRRPRLLVVMAPPAALVLLGLVYRRLTGAKLVVDCHSKAVLGEPLSWRLTERADLTLVTLPELSGGRAGVVAIHDPPATAVSAPRHDEVLFPASWYSDEPTAELLDAARSLPELRFAITGRAPAGLNVPGNVRLTGYLSRDAYLMLLAGSPLILALTTREATMQRAAYEAVAAGRPVVATDTVALRSYLADAAVYAKPADLAAAISEAMQRLPGLEAEVAKVRTRQARAFSEALHEIGERLAP